MNTLTSTMNRSGHKGIKFFVGTEVEHSPAFGLRTLFVVGVQPVKEIISQAIAHNVKHIYFGANMSFPKISINDYENWSIWEKMIHTVLDHEEEFWVTLDIDYAVAQGILESGLTENHRFIPMISVKMPYIQHYGYNATLKIDDSGFKESNPGVWCHRMHTLMDTKQFTPWANYKQDQVLK